MKCFHRTPYPHEIIKNGFRDGEGYYLTDTLYQGVWLSNVPLDSNEGAKGDFLLSLEIPEEVLAVYEWKETVELDGQLVEWKTYREFLVPAEKVNSFGPPTLEDEEDEYRRF